MDKIVLTKCGDALVSFADTKKTKDSNELPSSPGDHLHLNEEKQGSFTIFTVSPDWRRMTCRMCNLTVEFPIGVKTYGDLRAYFDRRP